MLPEFITKPYASELERLKAVRGFLGNPPCPRCGGKYLYPLKKRLGMYQCASCRSSFSGLKGTPFYWSKTSLKVLFEITKLMYDSPHLAHREVASTLGVTEGTTRRVYPKIKAWLYTLENEDKNRPGRQKVQPVDTKS